MSGKERCIKNRKDFRPHLDKNGISIITILKLKTVLILSVFTEGKYVCRTGRSFFSLLAREGKLPGIRNIGTYYYDDPVDKKNGEFDIALDYGESVTIVEAEFLKNPMTRTMLHHEAGQIREITNLQLKNIGFLSTNGFEEKESGFLYFQSEDMYLTAGA